MSRRGRRSGPKRSYTVPIALTLVVITGVVGYYIFTTSGIAAGNPLDGTAVSSTVLNDLNGVTVATLNTVGSGSGVSSPTSTASSSGTQPALMTLNGKPEVLYMGAEYCPFCAAERWSMIVALDKFGSFSGIEYMQSSAGDIYPNTPTFTFLHASYTSSYITFVSVEQEDRGEQPLQTATPNQTALMNTYDSKSSIPFIDYAGQYVQVGAQYTPPTLAGANWTQIASQLNTPSSTYALSIDGAANRIISVICKIDGDMPSAVCSQSLAATLSYVGGSPSGGSQLMVSDAVPRGPAPSVAAAARSTAPYSTARV